jgi:hypothetical protein
MKTLVERDIRLARFDHHLDFLQVLGPVAGTARMDEDPAFPVGRSAHAEAIGGRGRAARFGFAL